MIWFSKQVRAARKEEARLRRHNTQLMQRVMALEFRLGAGSRWPAYEDAPADQITHPLIQQAIKNHNEVIRLAAELSHMRRRAERAEFALEKPNAEDLVRLRSAPPPSSDPR
jgi:hypothetical protein